MKGDLYMSKEHPGRRTEFAKFRRLMARLDAQMAKEKAATVERKRENKERGGD